MLHHIVLKVHTNICEAAQWSCHTAKAWKIVWGFVCFFGHVRPTQSPASAGESCCDSCDSSTFAPFQLWLLPGKRHWLIGHSHHNTRASSAFPVSLHVCTRRTNTPCLHPASFQERALGRLGPQSTSSLQLVSSWTLLLIINCDWAYRTTYSRQNKYEFLVIKSHSSKALSSRAVSHYF